MDFTDIFRGVVGVSTGGGVRVAALGAVETGWTIGIKPHAASIGLRYGRGFLPNLGMSDLEFDAEQTHLFFTHALVDCDSRTAEFRLARRSAAVLPAVFTWVESAEPDRIEWRVPEEGAELESEHYLWTSTTLERVPYAVVHAFDVELEVGIVGYLDLGVSPGEMIDFLLGFLTIDIAGDDLSLGTVEGGEE